MRKSKLFSALTLVLVMSASCSLSGGDQTKKCVKYMMSQGYDYDEAYDSCLDAKYDSRIRH